MTTITLNCSYRDPETDLLTSDPVEPPDPGDLFPPLLALDFSGETVGLARAGWNSKSVYANDQPGGVGTSLKLTLDPNTQANLDVAACGGNHFFGGRENLPADIEIGESLWLMQRRVIPTGFTWGYCYANADFAAAEACGQSGDGNAWLKDLVLSPRSGFARFYVQPAVERRNITQTSGNRVICEQGPIFNDAAGILYPINTEFTLQIYVKVSNTAAGIIRVWINGTLVNEVTGANVTAANAIREWGIGDYWNGVPYTNGSATLHQWLIEVIAATDKAGYGAPTTVDSFGNPYIDPALRVSDF